MANHLSTKKAIRKIVKKSIFNKNRKTKIRSCIKKSFLAIEACSKEQAYSLFALTQAEIMRGVSKGIIKKNTASRRIARLAKKLKLLF